MTYPPQQPGPQSGGWGQPGGQYPQSGPQQPGPNPYGQPGGQYPPSGPQQQGYNPHQGAGQPGPYGPQGPYGQPGPYGPQGPYGQPTPYGPQGPYGQPPKKTSPVPWIFGGLGIVVVVGVAITLVLTLTGGAGDPRPTAEAAVEKLRSKDFAGLQAMACQEKKGQGNELDPSSQMEKSGIPKADAERMLQQIQLDVHLDDVQDNGDYTATARMSGRMTMNVLGRPISRNLGANTQSMKVEDGEWKLC